MCRLMIASCVALLLLAAFAPRATTQKPLDKEEEALWKFTPAKEDPKDDALRKLQKERYNAAVDEVNIRVKRMQAGTGEQDLMIQAAQRVVEAGLELNDKPADQVALLEKHVALAKYYEKVMKGMVDAGLKGVTAADAHYAKYARATAEIRLLRAQEKLKGEKK